MKRSRLAFTVAALLVIACSSDQIAGPRRAPGFVALRLSVPQERSGALLVMLRGGVIDSVTSAELGLALLATAPAEYSLLARGELHEGAIVRLWVPDPTVPDSATIAQATEGYQRTEPGAYVLSAVPGL